jgi:hypothetical protein
MLKALNCSVLALRVWGSVSNVTPAEQPATEPTARVDLTTDAGTALVHGTWRYADAKVIEASFRAPDADGQPTGVPVLTNDIVPHAGVAEFDDSKWEVIAATSLSARRGNGMVSFNGYESATFTASTC